MTIVIVVTLVLLSGIFSGLTLGLMGLNGPELKRKAALGNKRAARVYEVRKDGNLLLVTLLLGNVAVNTALSIFLGSLTAGIIAGVLATGLIVIFGEIVPQAVFARHGLLFGSRLVWLVNIFIFLLFPIARPIASVLDRALGNELQTMYSHKELLKIIQEHRYSKHSDLDEEEEQIIQGALTFSSLRAKDVMTRRDKVYMLEANTHLTDEKLHDIRDHGWSRMPVYEGSESNIVGILFAKNLIGRDVEECTARDLMETNVIAVQDRESLDDIFEQFIDSRQHLFIVKNDRGACVGVVSFEDVIEEIISEEIHDENDELPSA